jgi:hypothetical protein
LPVALLPVKESLSRSGCSTKCCAASGGAGGPPVSTLSAPAGRPASCAISPRRTQVSADSGDGFSGEEGAEGAAYRCGGFVVGGGGGGAPGVYGEIAI